MFLPPRHKDLGVSAPIGHAVPTPIPALEGDNVNREDLAADRSAAAPAKAPNVLVVLLDDMGFGASSAFGGPCRMPVADELAAGGLRYSRFHTTALCSPTRTALLSGRNHHSVAMGTVTNLAVPGDGYDAYRSPSKATLARTLNLNGYATGAFGKMHQTPMRSFHPRVRSRTGPPTRDSSASTASSAERPTSSHRT